MKRLFLFLFALSLRAATYHVNGSTGDDANVGSLASPWLTFRRATSSVVCGDTIVIDVSGTAVAGDATLQNMPCPSSRITVRSSLLANINTVPGYRINPATDGANLAKLTFTSGGIAIVPQLWTTEYGGFNFASVSFDTSGNWITITSALAYTGLANGMQVEFEGFAEGTIHTANLAFPTGTTTLQHYFAVNCGASPMGSSGYPQTCGQVNSRFQLATSSGGSPIALGTCGPPGCYNTVTSDPSGACSPNGLQQYNTTDNLSFTCVSGTWAASAGANLNVLNMGVTLNVDTSANTITIPHNYGSAGPTNGMKVYFASTGYLVFGTLPAPLQLDTPYYLRDCGGNTCKVAATLGGAVTPLTTVGTGMVTMAGGDIATNWSFLGLDMAPNGTSIPFFFFEFGSSYATSVNGMPTGMEIGWSFLHDNPPTQGITHAIIDNSAGLNIHDNWIIGANYTEAQAISGTGSPGPTTITNNFLEAAGEITIYGGDWPATGIANANKTFSGNYFYKPPIWKISTGTVAASGPCLYDATDPTHAGGEWYKNTSSGTYYQCGSDFLWHTSSAMLPGTFWNSDYYTIKNMTEHKNGRYFTYSGNVYNYSISQDQSGQIWNNSAQWGSGPGAADDHITITNNKAFNIFTFNVRTVQCDPTVGACPITPGNHVTTNNLAVFNPLMCGTSMNPSCAFSNSSPAAYGGGFVPYFANDLWNHNTLWYPDTWSFGGKALLNMPSPGDACPPFSPKPYTLITYENSLVAWDMAGNCETQGAIVADFIDHSTFNNNALKAGASGGYGSVGATNIWANTAYPANNAAIKWVNGDGTINGDYHLDPTSNFSAANGSATQLATDGTDLGADVDLVNMATSGVLAGTPPWNASLRVNPGSTKLLLSYQAPTTAACTATIYSAAPRITGNVVGSAVADSAASSISDVLTRQLYISGLTASTHYWYKLVCGGGVIMVGDFFTRGAGSGTYNFAFDYATSTAMRYSASATMSSPTTLSAATHQLVPVSTDSVIYAQIGTAGVITVLIAP